MTAANIERFLRGAYEVIARPDGLVRPVRFSQKQVAAATEAGRLTEARATSGVCIDLVTTGDEVSFDLDVLEGLEMERPALAQTVEGADGADTPEAGLVDGVDLYVDGVFRKTVAAVTGLVTLSFDNPNHAPVEVRVYLPSLMSVAVGNLCTNGSLDPAPERPYLLALGDSITQGYVVGAPGLSWPARVARACGLDLVNQALAGHHFDKHTLRGIKELRENPPALVVVAYGTNDWSHLPDCRSLVKGAAKYLERVSERFPTTPVYVVSPIWRADEEEPRPCGVSLAWVRSHLAQECSRLGFRYVEGADAVPHDTALYADGRLHPGAEGARHMSERVLAALDHDGLLRLLGGRQDTPEALADAQSRLRAQAPGSQHAFERAVRTIWRLRQQDGCPWDREQTHESIKKNMIEEAYEAVDTIEAGDSSHLREELGDVLMQVLLHSQIADDAGEFSITDVCEELNEKLVRRHPHVFGEGVSAADTGEVLDIWSKVKLDERKRRAQDGSGSTDSLLDAVPRALPALMQAQKVSKKAAACGFDWDGPEEVWRKVAEERSEFEAEPAGSEAAFEEFGDILFALVNVARKEGIDAEMALRAACEKFRRRWAAMEIACAKTGSSVEDCGRDVLEELWCAAKNEEVRAS